MSQDRHSPPLKELIADKDYNCRTNECILHRMSGQLQERWLPRQIGGLQTPVPGRYIQAKIHLKQTFATLPSKLVSPFQLHPHLFPLFYFVCKMIWYFIYCFLSRAPKRVYPNMLGQRMMMRWGEEDAGRNRRDMGECRRDVHMGSYPGSTLEC